MSTKLELNDVNIYYGDFHAVQNVNMQIPAKAVTAFIGPSGCGKSTFLRCINRMNDVIDGCRIEGEIKVDGTDIYRSGLDVVELRARVGMGPLGSGADLVPPRAASRAAARRRTGRRRCRGRHR